MKNSLYEIYKAMMTTMEFDIEYTEELKEYDLHKRYRDKIYSSTQNSQEEVDKMLSGLLYQLEKSPEKITRGTLSEFDRSIATLTKLTDLVGDFTVSFNNKDCENTASVYSVEERD